MEMEIHTYIRRTCNLVVLFSYGASMCGMVVAQQAPRTARQETLMVQAQRLQYLAVIVVNMYCMYSMYDCLYVRSGLEQVACRLACALGYLGTRYLPTNTYIIAEADVTYC